jgi:hypothetical protein
VFVKQSLTCNVDDGEAQLNEQGYSPRVIVGSPAHRDGDTGRQNLADVVERVEETHASSTVVRTGDLRHVPGKRQTNSARLPFSRGLITYDLLARAAEVHPKPDQVGLIVFSMQVRFGMVDCPYRSRICHR